MYVIKTIDFNELMFSYSSINMYCLLKLVFFFIKTTEKIDIEKLCFKNVIIVYWV